MPGKTREPSGFVVTILAYLIDKFGVVNFPNPEENLQVMDHLQSNTKGQQSSLRPAPSDFIITSTDSLERPAIESGNQICYFCRNNVASYTCPRCHAHYCSVSCYKSPLHDPCLESINTEQLPKGSLDENQGEEGSNNGEQQEVGDDDPALDDNELEVLVENASEEELWSMLTLEERRGFFEYYKAQGGT